MNPIEIRQSFKQLNNKINEKPFVYFDTAATCLKPEIFCQEIHNHYQNETSNVHRGSHHYSDIATEKYEQTRKAVQSFIGAKKDCEIIFTKGTTESLNLIASCLGSIVLGQDDIIALSTLEHHSNIVPWQLIAQQRKAKVIEIPINQNGDIDMDTYQDILKNNKVKIVSVTHISNAIGTVNPIKEMCSLCHKYGAIFVLDAAQSIPHRKIDVQDLDCDFLAFSAHKTYGPSALGILYAKEKWLEKMPPYQGGGGMIDQVSFEKTTYALPPEKFEAGTGHVAGVIAFHKSLNFLNKITMSEIKKQEEELTQYAVEKLENINGVNILGHPKERSTVMSFSFFNYHPFDIGMILNQQGIAVRTGHLCAQPLLNFFKISSFLRISLGIYNNKEDIDYLQQSLKTVVKLLGS